jgi:hypothetical protein
LFEGGQGFAKIDFWYVHDDIEESNRSAGIIRSLGFVNRAKTPGEKWKTYLVCKPHMLWAFGSVFCLCLIFLIAVSEEEDQPIDWLAVIFL